MEEQDLKDLKPRPISPGRQIFLLILLVFSALYVVGPFLFVMIRPLLGDVDFEKLDWGDPNNAYLSAFASSFAILLVGFVLFLRLTKLKFRTEIQLSKWNGKTLGVVLLLLVVGIFITEGLTMLNHFLIEQFPQSGFLEMEAEQIENYRKWFDPEKPQLYLPAIFLFGLMPAVAEELVFRGLLLRKLNQVSDGNTHFAVIVSAMLFAGLHMQPWNLLPMIFMGVLFGYIYVYYKDIGYTILMHFLFNASQITIAFFFAAEQSPV